MSNAKKWGDKEIAALCSTVIIFSGVLYHWVLEAISTVELLELAYGTVKLFNNPLVF